MMKTQFEDILRFWFPPLLKHDQSALAHQWQWWFRGGANAEIIQRFVLLLERATKGELDDWLHEPRSRLARLNRFASFRRYRNCDCEGD
jgi:uncharacterized protein (DUF924 family)